MPQSKCVGCGKWVKWSRTSKRSPMRSGQCPSCHQSTQSPLDTLAAAALEVEAKSTVASKERSLADEIKACSCDNNGIISIPTCGRPMQLLQLPSTDSPSSQADQRTLDRRSTIIANGNIESSITLIVNTPPLRIQSFDFELHSNNHIYNHTYERLS